MAEKLHTPILEGGIRHTNFFNGRLLTAEDLNDEQEAIHQYHWQLGQALGDGVVRGLEVQKSTASSTATTTAPTIEVSAGLAVNRRGRVLSLDTTVRIALTPETKPATAAVGKFDDCSRPVSTAAATSTGIYILTIAPASGFEESAPMHRLDDGSKISGCGSRYAVDGVQFKLAAFKPDQIVDKIANIRPETRTELNSLTATADNDPSRLSRLRNLLAHLCFGNEEMLAFAADPYRPTIEIPDTQTYGAVDALRALGGLTDCEVPLAIIYLTPKGIRFIDMWAVRRRLVPQPPTGPWPFTLGARRLAEAEAAHLQFQDHLAEITNPSTASSQTVSIKAVEYFRYLPPAGLIPVASTDGWLPKGPKGGTGNIQPTIPLAHMPQLAGAEPLTLLDSQRWTDTIVATGLTAQPWYLSQARMARQFELASFFEGLKHRKLAFIEGRIISALLRKSFSYAPIDLKSAELIWLYVARESQQLITASGANAPTAYVVFTNGHMDYQGDGHYDLNYWGYGQFA